MISALRNEHFLAMFMAVAFAGMWLALAIVINVAESEASDQATLVITVIAVVIACFPLAALFLSIRTVWPRRPTGFEPAIHPDAVLPGESVTVTAAEPWPDDVRFLCVETYHRTYMQERTGLRRRYSQFETYEHSDTRLSAESGVCSLSIPVDAAPSYDGKQAQIKWVVRRGGRKIGRWGPIRLEEWGVVVVDPDSTG